MTSYRCASCGSANVMTDTQAGGVSYDYKKGIIGTVVLGPGGAVAGVSSKSQTVYKCADCGMCLTYSMPDDLRLAIDLCVDNEFMRDKIELTNDRHLSWNRIKQLYKNIESGAADRLIERRESFERDSLSYYATATKEEFDHAVDTLVEYEESNTLPQHMTLSNYLVWQDALYTFIESAAKYLPKKLPEKYRGMTLGTTFADSPARNAGNMLKYFFTYLVEKVSQEKGRAVFKEDLIKYVEDEPFPLMYMNWFFIHHFVPFGGIGGEEDVPHTPDTFMTFEGRAYSKSIPRKMAYHHYFPEINGEKAKSVFIPAYLVKNGIIGHWRFSGQRSVDNDAVLADYLKYNPKKKTEIENRVAEFNASFKDHSADIIRHEGSVKFHEEKIKTLESQIARNNSSIEAKRSQIETLRKKIFGKKAARAEADELEQRIQAMLAENEQANQEKEKHAQEISTCKQTITSLKDNEKQKEAAKKDFYETLARDMDYFIFWRWDSDAFRERILEIETAEKIEKMNRYEATRYYISDEAKKIRENTLNGGLQHTKNMEADIMQYLAAVKIATVGDITDFVMGEDGDAMAQIDEFSRTIVSMSRRGLIEKREYDTKYYVIPGQFVD